MRKSDIKSRYVTSFLSRRFARPFIYSVILALVGFSLASAYRPARAALTYVVVNVLDTGGACLPGPIPGCTLRQALTTAVTGNSITFAIPGAGPFTIMPASLLPTISQGITIDGTTQLGASCGPAFALQIVIDGTSAPGAIGLLFGAGSQGSIVKGLVIDNFNNDGIVFQNSGSNTLTCSMIGTDSSGTIAQPNTGAGIAIFGGTNTTIGGIVPTARNIISGNGAQGIDIRNAGTNTNFVEGNYIGTDLTGSLPLGNLNAGVSIQVGAQLNTISGNLLSDNAQGIALRDPGTSGNIVTGNLIGTNAAGTGALGNVGDGIDIFVQASGNRIGGTTPAERNIVSSNLNRGIAVLDPGTNTNTVEGNYVGTDITGTLALGNTNTGIVVFNGAQLNTVSGNVASGNGLSGIDVKNSGTTNNTITGNFVGTNAAVTLPLGNLGAGIALFNGAQSNTVSGNVSSGNRFSGIDVLSAGTNNNTITGNFFGTNATGTLALGNQNNGIAIYGTAQTNTVSGNIASGNAWSGIAVDGAGTNGNIVVGNKIGTNAAGTAAVPNTQPGVVIFNGAQGNQIGGTTPAERNIVSGNIGSGIDVTGAGTNTNLVEGNYVGTDITGTLALGNQFGGVQIFNGAQLNTVSGNVISGNVTNGLAVDGAGANGNTIIGNFIGTNAAGTAAIPNTTYGVGIFTGASNNRLGGTTPAERNIISGNTIQGVGVDDPGTDSNIVEGNYIGVDITGMVPLANGSTGVTIFNGTTNNRVGGTTPAERNIIAASGGSGVRVHDAGTTGNVVEGNYIGTNVSGTSFAGFGNALQGIDIYNGANGNTIGGTAPGAGNLVAGNGQNGIRVADVGTSANNVWGNLVGTNSGGTPLSNAQNGILIGVGASANFIGGTAAGQGNTIAYNVGAGVLIFTLGNNPVRGNSIYSNGALGINYTIPSGSVPVFTSTGTVGYNYQISGTLTATASTTYAIDFYASAVGDPSGSGQGQNYVGTATVTTDAAGNASFGPVTFPIVGGRAVLSATATGSSGSGDTSKFSVDATVILPNPPVTASGGGSGSGSGGACLALTLTTPQQTVLTDEQVTLSATLTNNCGQALNNMVVIVQVGQPLTILSPNPNCRQVTFTVGTLNSGQQFIGSVLVSTRSVQSASVTTLPAIVAQTDGRQLASFIRRPFAPQSMSALRVQTVVNVVEARWDDQNVRTASQTLNVIPNGSLPGTGEHPEAAQLGTTSGLWVFAAFGLIVGLIRAVTKFKFKFTVCHRVIGFKEQTV